VKQACAAAALSVTKAGAQGGMPTAAELAEFLKQQA
jgi:ribokinase